MRLRVGLLKERKFLENINDWTVQELECEVRKEFSIPSDANIGIYLGDRRVNNLKAQKLTELGIVSGDLLMTKIELAGYNNSKECAEDCEQSTSRAQIADTALVELPASTPDECSEDQKMEMSMFLSLLHERMERIGYEEVDRYSLDEPVNKTRVYYYASGRSNVRIRFSCTLFFDDGLEQKNVHIVQCNATLINGKNMMHFDRKDFNDDTKLCVFDDFVEELKTAIFGPENPMLRTVFCTDIDLTLKIFELCGLESVCALRRTCKIAYKKMNSRYIDQKYWRRQYAEIFGDESLPTDNDSTTYRKNLFKRIREHQKMAWLQAMRESARAEMSNCRDRQREEHLNFYHVPTRNLRPQRPNYDPLQVDLLRNFDENFYGQEVYRPVNPNPYIPGVPVVLPTSRDGRVVRRPSPSSDLNKPWQPFGNRHYDDRFI